MAKKLLILLAAAALLWSVPLLAEEKDDLARTVDTLKKTLGELETIKKSLDDLKNAGEKAKKESVAAEKKLERLAEKGFVIVRIHPKKDLEKGDEERRYGSYASADYLVERLVMQKETLDLSGVLVGDKGRVLIPDLSLSDVHIKKIEIIDGGGKHYPAMRVGILASAPGTWLQITGDDIPVGIAFKDPGDVTAKTKLSYAAFSSDEDGWEISTGAVGKPFFWKKLPRGEAPGKSFRYFPSPGGGYAEAVTSSLALLFNKAGDAVGCNLYSKVHFSGGPAVWKGAALLKDRVIPFKDMKARHEALQKKYTAMLHEVKIKFWTKSASSGISPGDRRYMAMWGESGYSDGGRNEVKLFALGIGKDTLLLPHELGREAVTRIEKITVGKEKLEAEFVGEYKKFAAVVFKLKKGTLASWATLKKDAKLAKVKPFLTMHVERKFDKCKATIDYNRCLHKRRGYKNRYFLTPSRGGVNGDYLLDMDGNLIGIYTREKRDEEAIEAVSRQYYHYGRSRTGKLYMFSEMRRELGNPVAFMDETIQPKNKKEAARPLWLGIEYYPIKQKLAKALKCLKETKDGSMGLIVAHVYPGSPAVKLGLKERDIILTIKKKGSDLDPIELKGNEYEAWDFGGSYREKLDTGDIAHEFNVPITWRSQHNYLNTIIKAMGKGSEITITYLSGGTKREKTFVAEKSPATFESADKYKDETSGLTVKELTFEVRHALKLDKKLKGVIVCKIESGGSAALARIHLYDILFEAGGKPVGGPKALETVLAEARTKKDKKIILALRRLNQTEVVHMGLAKIEKKKRPAPPAAIGTIPR